MAAKLNNKNIKPINRPIKNWKISVNPSNERNRPHYGDDNAPEATIK